MSCESTINDKKNTVSKSIISTEIQIKLNCRKTAFIMLYILISMLSFKGKSN